MKTLKIFIGYDPKEAVAFHVLCHSLMQRSSKPISITPINLKNLKGLYSRQHDQRQSNEFSFSRFQCLIYVITTDLEFIWIAIC